MKFLDELSSDLKISLLQEIKTLWSHTSTAIEGNTLTLGETHFVITEGLTINGKSLKDHKDVEGHAKAVDAIWELLNKETIAKDDLFHLHKLVINDATLDVYKPVGEWKKEDNSTSMVVNNAVRIINYTRYYDTDVLMDRWLERLNSDIRKIKSLEDALRSYAELHISFVSVHSFFDGNGRMARLLCNLPLLKAGYPPIIIRNEEKYDYKTLLAEYQVNNGVPALKTDLIKKSSELDAFMNHCKKSWEPVWSLIEAAKEIQNNRGVL
jgi:Fic family protein